MPILSLDDWLETAGSFMKDILGMTGVRSGLSEGGEKPRGGRKSIAGKIGGTGMGKPEFADLVVAGGCKSLFHQLYLSVCPLDLVLPVYVADTVCIGSIEASR